MVTGIELAGIILAVFPLLISAAEHLDIGLQPLNSLIFNKKKRRDLQQAVNESSTLFRQCCESMLSIAEVDNIGDLIQDSKQRRRLWADPELATRLLSTFGSNDFGIIQSRLVEIDDLIRKLHKDLDAGRIQQAFRSRSQAKNIDLLDKAIVTLKTILAGESLSVVIGTAGTAWQKEIEEMKLTGTHLLNIFACVGASWVCACKMDHAINFQCKDIKDKHLTIVLAASSSRAGTTLSRMPWLPQPLQIRIYKENPSTPSKKIANNLCKSLKKGKGVTNLSPTLKPQPYYYSAEICVSQPDHIALVPLPSLLKKAQTPISPSGTIGHGQKDLLRTPKDRIAIGARLLITVLQQHSSPWLQPDWTISDVFLRAGEGCSLHPSFEARFGTPTAPSTTNDSSNPFKPLFSRNAILYRLGVALIEIAMNDTINNLTTDEDMAVAAQNPSMGQAVAAWRMSGELDTYLIPLQYRNATRYCLKGEFEMEIKGKELIDDDLFSAIYRKAAKPLMDMVASDCY